jgi:hypothetical protein
MAKKLTKRCSKCGEEKPTNQFNKESKSPDGYQAYCTCCKKEIHGEYMKSNKSSLIYRIVNPIGDTYIGSTQRLLHLRFTTHRADYNLHLNNKITKFPMLYKSFDKWGIDAHTFELVADLGNISSEQLRVIESKMIIALKKNGKSLNVNN